jgi:hypothetical protein
MPNAFLDLRQAILDLRQGHGTGCALVALASAVGLVLAKDFILLSLCKQILRKEFFAVVFGQHV